ncbi:MAG: Gfo/Idh/MocA family oxidoreductase [Planctomycetes bacterium]|nr:Gfo/Idh/MocA family oxidoreductase [Planctomycetota bacterium]
MSRGKDDPLRVGVAGIGYWGINLLRVFHEVAGCRVAAFAECDARKREAAAARYPAARAFESLDAMLDSGLVEALVVATPAEHHEAAARAALARGCHLFLEKPFALSVASAQAMVDGFERAGKTLMAGHTFCYNPAVERIREEVQSGRLGRLLYVTSRRLSLGQVRTGVNVLWNLAPHDVSILLYCLGAVPERGAATGSVFLQPGLEDVVWSTLSFPGGMRAHLELSWISPLKVRDMVWVGTRRMIQYDDVDPAARIRIYENRLDGPAQAYDSYGTHLAAVRSGDVSVPTLPNEEPLRREAAHFVGCVRTGERPRTDGLHGLAVTRVLEGLERSMRQGGASVGLR